MWHCATMTKTTPPSFIGSAEACELLGIDRSTLSRWVASGRLPLAFRASTEPNAALIFALSDVEAVAAARAK